MVPPRVQLCPSHTPEDRDIPRGAGSSVTFPRHRGTRCDMSPNSCTRVATTGARPPAHVASSRLEAAEAGPDPLQSPQFLFTSSFRPSKKGSQGGCTPGHSLSHGHWQRHSGSCALARGTHGTGQGWDRESCQMGPSRGHRPRARTLDCPRAQGRWFVSPPSPDLPSPAQCVCSAEGFWESRQRAKPFSKRIVTHKNPWLDLTEQGLEGTGMEPHLQRQELSLEGPPAPRDELGSLQTPWESPGTTIQPSSMG